MLFLPNLTINGKPGHLRELRKYVYSTIQSCLAMFKIQRKSRKNILTLF